MVILHLKITGSWRKGTRGFTSAPGRLLSSLLLFCQYQRFQAGVALMSSPSILALVIVFFYTTLITAQEGQCFLPDGTVAFGDRPCGPAPAQCCSGTCLSNGLCFNEGANLLSRSSCTDSTWTSSVCTTICKAGKHT